MAAAAVVALGVALTGCGADEAPPPGSAAAPESTSSSAQAGTASDPDAPTADEALEEAVDRLLSAAEGSFTVAGVGGDDTISVTGRYRMDPPAGETVYSASLPDGERYEEYHRSAEQLVWFRVEAPGVDARCWVERDATGIPREELGYAPRVADGLPPGPVLGVADAVGEEWVDDTTIGGRVSLDGGAPEGATFHLDGADLVLVETASGTLTFGPLEGDLDVVPPDDERVRVEAGDDVGAAMTDCAG